MRRSLTSPFVFVALFAIAHAQQGSTTQGYPPPGHLVDIGNRKLHLYCTGKGSPAVILVAGGGAFSIDWALVQPKVSENTRVCSYDRAGLAWSDPGPAEETVEETVNDLHNLLYASGEHGPYVLVGASIGGIFIQAFQRTFPSDVAALVFTNSANRVGFAVKDRGGLIWDLSEEELRSAFPLPPSVKRRSLSIAYPPICRRSVCGSICVYGRSPTLPKHVRIFYSHGERNFCESSTRPTPARSRRSDHCPWLW
jgi:pimeloyl-ACP methyl ester carboxylesterase